VVFIFGGDIVHIPDGYLGPQTYGTMLGIMVPIWIKASRVLNKTLKMSQVPLIAIGAAFSFVIMMFNVPIPGGTTGHAVGGVLLSILIGPWATLLVITIVLVIQAIIFGDGGITAIGANCFNMGFILPFVGYYTYKLISGNSPINSKRRIIAAGIGGYIGLNVAALFAGIELGLQPLISHTDKGVPLYSPYPLSITVPAMLGEHLILFGWVEAIVTMAAFAYLIRINFIKEWKYA
jgi:cobalt/nickel transport system permease protein